MDPVADMIAQIKTAILNNETELSILASRFKGEILKILKKEGFVKNFTEKNKNNKKYFSVDLNFIGKKPAITQIKKISKPGLRIYKNYNNIPRPLKGLGRVIVSTSKGVMEGNEARNKKIGGEIICIVY